MGLLDLSPYKVTNNSSNVDATTQDSMIDAIQAVVNALVDANIDPAAAIAIAKLAAGTNGQVVKTVAGVPTWTTVPAAAVKDTTLVTVGNTTTLTDLVTYTIPANTLGASGNARFTVRGDLLQNQTGAQQLTWAVFLNGVQVLGSAGVSITQSASRSPFAFQLDFANLGATNSNYVSVPYLGTFGGIAATGLRGTANTDGQILAASTAVDTTSGVAVRIAVSWLNADPLVTLTKRHALIEYI